MLICFFAIENLPAAVGQDSRLEHPWRLLKEQHTHILQLSSDQEALEFNQRFMPKPRRSQQHPTRKKSSRRQDGSNPISQELRTTITTFWAAMTTIAQIQNLHAIPVTRWHTNDFLDKLSSDAQQEWILLKPSLQAFKHLWDILRKLSVALPQDPVALSPDNEYSQFAYFHDQADSPTDDTSWTNLLNNRGFTGIETRLHEYWKHIDEHDTQRDISDSQKNAYIQQYVVSRLLPVFHAYLLTLSIQAERQAYDVSLESWHHMQHWQQQEQTNHAMMRLCGTWKWMIHNHQNHGDHKTTMTFLPPGQSSSSHVQPTTILIHGDTVFLRWTFPQGIQEDSLLLSNHDLRLEGTFTNSLGPHGSISGQRLSPCTN